jgi:hypothetical protein
MRLAPLAYVLGGGVVGGLSVWLLQNHSLSVWPRGISYADLIAVLLTGVSLIVAVFSFGLGIFAIWGITQFRKLVEKRTHAAVLEFTPALLVEELRLGQSRTVLVNLVTEFFANQKSQPGVGEAWNEQRKEEVAELNQLEEDL